MCVRGLLGMECGGVAEWSSCEEDRERHSPGTWLSWVCCQSLCESVRLRLRPGQQLLCNELSGWG